MIENQAKQAEEDQVDIEITEDLPEDAPEGSAPASNDDELERYTKQVSRRINKLNAKSREAEERAAQLERVAMQKEQELQQYRQQTVHYQQSMLQKEEESLKAKSDQVDEIYRKAVSSGDAELMSKADTLKTELAIQKEKLNAAKARQAGAQQAQAQQYQPQPEQYQQYQPEPQQQAAKPTDQALSWHQQNPWYGNQEDPDHAAATQLAYFTHFNLLNEGFEADSEDYYSELNKRVYRAYPNLQAADAGGEDAGKQESRPSVQRVASASVGGRQKTQTKRGVTFTKSEIERLRGLKPHNLSEEQWLQRVAKEKQKIAQREAR
jgi:hypothetical protein